MDRVEARINQDALVGQRIGSAFSTEGGEGALRVETVRGSVESWVPYINSYPHCTSGPTSPAACLMPHVYRSAGPVPNQQCTADIAINDFI
jgi:hypothetical protein